MDKSGSDCFVEQFHLRSPVEEFEEYSQSVLEHLRAGETECDESTYREAIALVLGKLRPAGTTPTALQGATQ